MDHPTPPQQQNRSGTEATRKLKIGIIVVVAALLVIAGISALLIPLLDHLNAMLQEQETDPPKGGSTIIFVERDDSYNAFKDSNYLKEDRRVYLHNEMTGETVPLDESNLNKYGDAVPVLYDMIQAIIYGNADAYNELFSSNYYAENQPEAPFRMQPLYDIRITRIRETDMETYTMYEFDVEYRICGNDGTFRTDIGHHESRKQHFVLSDSTGSRVLIDQINQYVYK